METVNAVGRRKAAIARVILTEGNGEITINHRELGKYFPSSILQYIVKQPLTTLDVTEKYNIRVNLDGGGSSTFIARDGAEGELKLLNWPTDQGGVMRKVATGLAIVEQ